MSHRKKEGSLYIMQGKLTEGEANVIVGKGNLKLWHKQLGHMSEKGLRILARRQILPDIIGNNLKLYIDYLARKQHRVAFSRSGHSHRRKHVLNLVHIDVCSMTEKSLGGALYFVSFIDDHSRKV